MVVQKIIQDDCTLSSFCLRILFMFPCWFNGNRSLLETCAFILGGLRKWQLLGMVQRRIQSPERLHLSMIREAVGTGLGLAMLWF